MKQAPAQFRFAAMAVDATIFSVVDGKLAVLLQPVASDSAYNGMEAFLGGLIRPSENAKEAVLRVTKEKGGITPEHIEQLYTFSDINRDKRNRVVSVAYLAFVRPNIAAAYNHEAAHFVPVKQVSKLAYDHNDILNLALRRLRSKVTYTNIVQYLLPRHFTLSQLQNMYELILDEELDKRNFRKKVTALNLVEDTGQKQEGVQNRPATLYRFTSSALTEFASLIK